MYIEKLKELREKNNLTQRKLAEVLNMPQNQYWNYETGKRDIPVKYLIELADLYKTTTDEILGRK